MDVGQRPTPGRVRAADRCRHHPALAGTLTIVLLEQVFEGGEYKTYIYQKLKEWDFGPKPDLLAGEIRLVREAEELGGEEEVVWLGVGSEAEAEAICKTMMDNAMVEHADTFSVMVALKVARFQVCPPQPSLAPSGDPG